MKIEEILKLKDAGFDNDSIIKFASAVQRLDEEEKPADKAPEKPSEAPEAIKPVQEIPEWSTTLINEIKGLKQTIQASNIRSIQQNELPKQKTAVEVMAEVLNAPGGKTK